MDVFAAVEGQIVEVAASLTKRPACLTEQFQAEIPIEPALAERSVLLGIGDTKVAAALSETVRAEGIHAKFFSDMDEARALMAKDRPSLAIFEHDPPRINGMEMCRAIRQQENDREHQLPVVMVAAQEDLDIGAAADVTDWLIKPFTDDKALTDGIIDDDENDRDGAGCVPQCCQRRRPISHKHLGCQCHQLRRISANAINISCRPTIFQVDVATNCPTQIS